MGNFMDKADAESDKLGLRFWIISLAGCIFFMAISFAFLAVYLSEIKANTYAAMMHSEALAQHLNAMDMEIAAIHRHILADKAGAAAIAPPPVAAIAPVTGAQPVVVPQPMTVGTAVQAVVPPIAPTSTTPPANAQIAPSSLIRDVTPEQAAPVMGGLPQIQPPALSDFAKVPANAPTSLIPPSTPSAVAPAKP
jgi:hypothetical protein